MSGLSFYDDLSALPRETRALVEQLIEEMRVERLAEEHEADPGQPGASVVPSQISDEQHRLAG